MAGFFFGDNAPDSYEARERNRKLAEAMMQQGMDYSPVKSWTQGASRLAQALVGGYEAGKYDKKDKEASDAYNKLAMSLFGGGASAPPVTPSTAMTSADAGAAPSPMAASGGANMPGDMSAWAAAIKKKESAGSGDYAAVGPTHPKLGRALGAYQVMESNIGPWSREALGREVTPEEFLRNPQIQDQIFQHKFGQYVQKFGNPQDAASAWFTGRPLAQGANARDVLGTTGAQYVSDFNRNIGQPQGAAPVQVASLGGVTPDGMPTSPVPSNAPPMAYAPAQQAIAGAAPQAPPPAAPRGQQLAQAVSAPPIPAPQPTGNVQAAMMAILSDPRFSPQQKNQALQMYSLSQRDEGVSPVDLGDKIALMNKRGQVMGVLPKQRAPVSVGEGQRLVDPVTGREVVAADGAKSPTVQRIKQPDGSEVAVQWDKDKREWVPLVAPQGGNAVAAPKLTEAQSKDVGFYNRGAAILPRLEKQDKALTDALSATGSRLPLVGNYLKSDAYRQAEQTGRELLAVILRKDTGAAVTDSEMQMYSSMYLPQPGDDAATIRQKQEGRKTALEGLRMGLGTAEILFRQREALDAAKGGQKAQGGDPAGALAAARDAIAKGAPREAVIKRLRENGIDATGL